MNTFNGMSMESYLDMYVEFTNNGDHQLAARILGQMLAKVRSETNIDSNGGEEVHKCRVT